MGVTPRVGSIPTSGTMQSTAYGEGGHVGISSEPLDFPRTSPFWGTGGTNVKASDLEPLDEFDSHTAQVLLGDSPSFRKGQEEFVLLLNRLIQESGDSDMIALLPELNAAHEAYRLDPMWVGGPGYVRLTLAEKPLLLFLGISRADVDLLFGV